MIIADAVNDIIGPVTPPPGPACLSGDPIACLGRLFSVAVQLVLILAGIVMLIYLLWGGFDWITCGGEKEKLIKARDKLVYAIIGMIIIVACFTIFGIVTGDILGIIKKTDSGWVFNLPSLSP